VKEQILNCKEALVLCNALCGNHDADHQAFQEINKDDAFDATVNLAKQNGMYKNQELCRVCSSKLKIKKTPSDLVRSPPNFVDFGQELTSQNK